VTSVAGRTGAVVIVSADLADLETTISNNVDVALNTGKTNYSDSGNVALLDTYSVFSTSNKHTRSYFSDGSSITASELRHANGSAMIDWPAYTLKSNEGVWLSEGQATSGDQIVNYTNMTTYVAAQGYGVGDFLADGSVKATGDFGMGGNSITNLASESASVSNNNAATTEYVMDTAAAEGWGNTSATFTPYFIPYALTVTVSRANGWMQSYLPTALTTIVFADGGTGGVDQVNLSLWAGTNSITFGTNNVAFSAAVTPETNSTTTILYYSPMWLTTWEATEL